ncbi:40-residue YVTN family beta-propeller repeat protein [Bacillus cereus AH1272]|nr:40-residue YVTN family beta-propeller repeat protein [Bacillus cereus AH1272]
MLFGETATPIGLAPTGMVAITVLVAVSITETVLEKILVT